MQNPLIEEDCGETTPIQQRARAFNDRFRIKSPALRMVIGVGLIAIGLLALVTPVTPGAWLALIGLELLGIHVTFTRRFAAWFRARGWFR